MSAKELIELDDRKGLDEKINENFVRQKILFQVASNYTRKKKIGSLVLKSLGPSVSAVDVGAHIWNVKSPIYYEGIRQWLTQS